MNPETDTAIEPGLKTRLYLVTHRKTGEKVLVDTYHPSKAVAIASADAYRVERPGPMQVVKLVQQGTTVLTTQEVN